MSHRESQASRGDQFTAFYLQQLTQELSNDVDKVRVAEDFKTDSVPFLVHALRQGSSQLSSNTKAVGDEHSSSAT
ncbi:hypothetical protein E4U24_001409 [Claviceps purpurea]|nr:hypothetical protein E4U24_001409 [Claviceps purpurea]